MTDAQSLQGRKALITGAGRGIGRALALGFARAGARVACAARTQAQVAAVADRIVRRGGAATALVCDVTQPAQVDAMCRAAHAAWNGLDLLVINAGADAEKSPVQASDPALWDRVLRTNLTGAYLCARAAIPYLKAAGGGHIIVIGSGMGRKGAAGAAAYCCSKAGLWMLTRVLAQELWADGIAVNELIPGPVQTDMLRQARAQDPELPAAWQSEWIKDPADVVPLALFLAAQPPTGPTAQSFSLMRRDA